MLHPTPQSEPTLLNIVFDALRPRPAAALVYPGYIAQQIKKALRAGDPERVIHDVSDVETIGDCRYAIKVYDFNGSTYRVTVEVLDDKPASIELRDGLPVDPEDEAAVLKAAVAACKS